MVLLFDTVLEHISYEYNPIIDLPMNGPYLIINFKYYSTYYMNVKSKINCLLKDLTLSG